MATFNLTFRSSFFTGANRIILSIRSKNIRGGGLAPSSEILAGRRGAIAPLGNLNGDVIIMKHMKQKNINAKQRKWVVFSSSGLINNVIRSVNNFPESIYTSSGRREYVEK